MLNNTSNPPASQVSPYSHIKQLLGACLLHTQPIPLLSRYHGNSSQAKHPERFASLNGFQPACSSVQEVPVEKASQMARVAINHSPTRPDGNGLTRARSSEHGRLGLIKPNIWKVFGHPSCKPFKTTLFPIPVKVKPKTHSAPRKEMIPI